MKVTQATEVIQRGHEHRKEKGMENYRITDNSRIGRVIDQVRWDMKRGVVEKISIDYIIDTAEEILDDDKCGDFVETKEYITVYQSA